MDSRFRGNDVTIVESGNDVIMGKVRMTTTFVRAGCDHREKQE